MRILGGVGERAMVYVEFPVVMVVQEEKEKREVSVIRECSWRRRPKYYRGKRFTDWFRLSRTRPDSLS